MEMFKGGTVRSCDDGGTDGVSVFCGWTGVERVSMDRRTARRYSLKRAMDTKNASGIARRRTKSMAPAKLLTMGSMARSILSSKSFVSLGMTLVPKVQAKSIDGNMHTPILLSA